MARIIVVTSGKGGVGKTTSSAAIATGLAQKGKKTVVIDFDIGLRNLDLIMGCERRVVYDFVNVIQGDATLNQALIKDKRTENLYILHRRLESLVDEFVKISLSICDGPDQILTVPWRVSGNVEMLPGKFQQLGGEHPGPGVR